VREPLAELGVDLGALDLPPALQRIEQTDELAALCSTWREGSCRIALVPTMGALHDGHASLLRRARALADRVVATIFVNPLQFGAGEDLARYPRTPEADLALCAREQVDAVFLPAPAQVYPDGFSSRVGVGPLADELEGRTRPGHFAGVATVVAKLFVVVRPQLACFGRKDAQQVAILRRLVLDLGFPLAIEECRTIREPDGLAMSSRNRFLEPADRRAAAVLVRALRAARKLFETGAREPAALLAAAHRVLAAEPRAQVDYLELRREGDLAPLPRGPVLAGRLLIAAWFGSGSARVRLIDNLSLAGAEDGEG
jgi:pantoate--beta-alanine ligase